MEPTVEKPFPAWPGIVKWILFICLIILLVVTGMVVLAFLTPVSLFQFEKADQIIETGKAKTLGMGVLRYAADHSHVMPSSLSPLAPKYVPDPSYLSMGYRYIPFDLPKLLDRPNTIILVEPGPSKWKNKKRIAVFADGSATMITETDYRKIMTKQGSIP